MTVTVPEFSWWYVGILCGSYGLLTHLVSLPKIRRYNKDKKSRPDRYRLSQFDLISLLIGRMFVALAGRLGCFVLGIINIPLELLSAGELNFKNDLLKYSWQWHRSPDKIARAFHNAGGGY